MKKQLLLQALLLILGTAGAFAQDMIYFRNKDIVKAKITEVTPSQVKYHLFDYENGPLMTVDKQSLIRIEFENGTVMNFNENRFYDTLSSTYRSALKVGFFSPLFDYFALTYEHAIKPNTTLEGTLGFIGTNTAQGYDYGRDRDVKGAMVRAGWKYIFPGRYSRSMDDNPLQGFYFRPDVLVGFYKQEYQTQVYDPNTWVSKYVTIKEDVIYASLLINFGKQWVIQERLCVDIFGGLGYNFSNVSNNSSYDTDWYWSYKGCDFGVYSSWDSPFAVTGGCRLGLTLK